MKRYLQSHWMFLEETNWSDQERAKKKSQNPAKRMSASPMQRLLEWTSVMENFLNASFLAQPG